MAKAVLTVVAGPDTTPLNADRLSQLTPAIQAYPVTVQRHHWLAAGKACDIYLEVDTLQTLNPLLEKLRPRFDVALSWQAGRRKKLLVADMDSTMVQEETLDLLASYYKLGDAIGAITQQTMRGEIDFEKALRARVALLKNQPVKTALARLLTSITYSPGATQLVQTMAAHGAYCALVSGGFTFVTAHIRQKLGFHVDYANSIGIKNGAFTGVVMDPVLDRAAKAQILKKEADRLNIAPSAALAVGDGANDLDMIQLAGMGVAYHGKPILRQHTPYHVTHGGLESLLYFQGYSLGEFV